MNEAVRRVETHWAIPDPIFDWLNAGEDWWTEEHRNRDYEDTWSMLLDEGVRKRIVDTLADLGASEVLIPGCGTREVLERDLARVSAVKSIVCTDFPGVVETLASKPHDPKIRYEGRDSTQLGWQEAFDAVVIVNSVLSNSDAENQRIVESCCEALRSAGHLIGYFPTIFSAVEKDLLTPEHGFARFINASENRFIEQKMRKQQIFYGPLRLRRILRQAGLELRNMDIEFFDSPYFQEHSRNYYGYDDPDLCVYELFVTARKR